MKRLGIKIVIVLLVMITIFILVNEFVKDSWEYNNNRPVLAFKEDPHPVDIINLGTSHSSTTWGTNGSFTNNPSSITRTI